MEEKITQEEKDYKKIYEQIRADSQLGVDSYVKYLSGGALVISLTFISDILPEEQCCTYLIIGAWSSLVLSLIVNFSSYFFTIRNCNLAIKEIDNGKMNFKTGVAARNKLIHFINYLSALLTIAGIIGITLFVTLNINNYG